MKRLLSFAVVAFALCSLSVAQVANDECSGAIPIVLGANPGGTCGTFTNAGATTSAGYPAICTTISSDLWYSFTAPTTGAYRFDTNTLPGCANGTETDTVLAVYASCGAGSAPIACDDDTGTGLLSSVSTGLCGGQTYFIRAGSFGSQSATNSGTFYLNAGPDTATFTQIFCSPAPGCVQINIVNGIPNSTYFLAATTNPGTFPNGWFFGIDITVAEIQNELNSGYPFVGTLDATGSTVIGPVCGLPSGLPICSVVLGFAAGAGLGIPQNVTAPNCFTIQ
jgi:hypothetical protein